MADYTTMTATPADTLKPYAFIGKLQSKEFGEMINHGAGSTLLQAGQSKRIEKGYYTGVGFVLADAIKDQTPGNVTPDKIIINKTIWSNGEFITGGVEEITNSSDNPKTYYKDAVYDGSYLRVDIKPYAYASSINHVAITGDILYNNISSYINLDYIASGFRIGKSSRYGTYTNDATAIASKLRLGKTIYAQGQIITGTMNVVSLY